MKMYDYERDLAIFVKKQDELQKYKRCKSCQVSLQNYSIILKDVDLKEIGEYCPSCYRMELSHLLNERLTHTYCGHAILEKDGKYYIWQYPYSFKYIEDVKKFIDNRFTRLRNN